MARYNSVPTGEAGTGAAYILPESRALNGLMENIAYNQKMGLLNIQARREADAQMNKDFQSNQIKAQGGILFQPELDAAMQDWTHKGAELRMKHINPWNPNTNDPEQVKAATEFINQKNMIEGMADTRKVYQENFLKQRDEYAKGGYDDDSFAAFNDFYSKNKLADLHAGGILPPTLTKAFDHSDFMKNVSDATAESNTIVNGIETKTTVANEDKIRYSIESNLAKTPQAERFYKKQWGVDESAAPLKTLMRTTDPKEITTTLDQYYKTDPQGIKEALKAFPSGTVPSYTSPEYKSFIDQQAKKQLDQETRYNAGLDNLTAEKVAGIDTKKDVGYNFGLNNELRAQETAARAAGADERAKITFKEAREEHAAKQGELKVKQKENVERDKFIKGIQIGNRDQMSSLRQLVKDKSGKVGYGKDGSLHLKYNMVVNGQPYPVKKVIDLSDKNSNGYTALNEVLSDLTGTKKGIEEITAAPKFNGALFKTESRDFSKEEVQYLRNAFPKMEDLGDYLHSSGKYKYNKDAYKAAAELLDPKGRYHNIKFK